MFLPSSWSIALLRYVAVAAVIWSFVAMPVVGAEKPKWGPDRIGLDELAAPHDPTFDSVARHFPMLRKPREALGVLESAREFIVLPRGELVVYNFQMDKPGQPELYMGPAVENQAVLRFQVGMKGQKKTLYGEGNRPDSKSLIEGYLPMVVVPFTHEGVEYRQTLFAWSQGMDPDGQLWGYVGLEMKNTGGAAVRVEVDHEAVCGKASKAAPTGHWEVELAPGKTQRLCVRIPRDGVRPDLAITKDSPEFKSKKRSGEALLPFCGGFEGVEAIEPAQYDRGFEESVQVWRKRLNRGLTIRVSEPRICDAYRAWLGYTTINVDKDGDRYFPHDGCGFYEAVWGVASLQYCRALDYYGYFQESERCLDAILSLVQPDGDLVTRFGRGPDMGTLFLAIETHYLITQDKAWLARVTPTMVKVADWALARREKEVKDQKPDSITYGLIAVKSCDDHQAPDYSYLTDTSLCAGLDAAARVLAIVGQEQAAKRIAAGATAYRRDIDRSIEKATFEHDGDRLIPILPVSRKHLVRANYGTNDYYNLYAGMVLETGYLAATDPRTDLIIKSLEKRSGLRAGIFAFDSWGMTKGIDHAFSLGYLEHTLQCNEPKKTILGLYGFLAYGMSRNTYSGVEVTDIGSGENMHTLPHLRSGTNQLKLLRMMLVREDGDRLVLAQAAPQHWLKSGQRVEVLDAPTAFGATSYTIVSATDQGRITVQLVPPRRNPPKEIQVFVRHPDGKPIRGATLAGKPITSFDAGSVTLRDVGVEAVSLELLYP